MFALRPTTRAAALALAMAGTSVVGLIAFPRAAEAAEYPTQDLPKSFADFLKMKPMDVMRMIDTGKKGYVTKEEYMKFQEAMFDKMDKNRDGKLDREEWMGGGG